MSQLFDRLDGQVSPRHELLCVFGRGEWVSADMSCSVCLVLGSGRVVAELCAFRTQASQLKAAKSRTQDSVWDRAVWGHMHRWAVQNLKEQKWHFKTVNQQFSALQQMYLTILKAKK